MQNVHEVAFQSDSLPSNRRIEGRVLDDAYDIQIHDVEWSRPGEGTFSPDKYCFVELLLNPIDHLKATYSEEHNDQHLQTIGKLLVVPPGATLFTRWTTGHQKVLSCMFDISKLGLIGGFEWNWQDVELQSTIDIENPFLESLMLRLSSETLDPGFASNLQIDCLLTLIAFELRRQFPVLGKGENQNTEKLSSQQIDTLRNMVEESTGIGPSLANLAAACNLLPRQLSEKFKNTAGTTLRHYVAETRIKKAKTLLLDKRLLVKEVAFLSGFQNAAAFTAAFRKAIGLTPQDFRDSSGKRHH